MPATDDTITLREYVDVQLATVHRDLDLLNKTIKDTADAHGKSHDRDHQQTELATSKSEKSLLLALDQLRSEFLRVDEERKRQINEIKQSIVAQGLSQAAYVNAQQGEKSGALDMRLLIFALIGMFIGITGLAAGLLR